MSRTSFAGSFLILEGEIDSKFWSQRIEHTQCQIVIAGGKATVTGSVIRANGIPITGILGIVDDDYDSLCGIGLPSQNTLRTDCRDLEATLIRSGAFDRVLHELGDVAKIATFEAAEAATVREALIKRSILFGKLRWLDRQNGWRFDFDKVSPFRFGNMVNWTIDESGLLGMIAPAVGMTVAQLTTALGALPVVDPYSVIHGKDTAAVFTMGLRSKLGSTQHPAERVCQMLRLAFDDTMANATTLFQGVRNWEGANAPYRVLR